MHVWRRSPSVVQCPHARPQGPHAHYRRGEACNRGPNWSPIFSSGSPYFSLESLNFISAPVHAPHRGCQDPCKLVQIKCLVRLFG